MEGKGTWRVLFLEEVQLQQRLGLAGLQPWLLAFLALFARLINEEQESVPKEALVETRARLERKERKREKGKRRREWRGK